MKRIFFTVLSIVAISSIGYSQCKNIAEEPYLETRAKVDTLVTPDKISISISLMESDSKGKLSVEKQEKEMIAALKEIGIDINKDLVLDNQASEYSKYTFRKDISKRKDYTLTVVSAEEVGKVFQILESAGISNMDVTKVEYSGADQLNMELKGKAVLKAKQQANIMTGALGQRVGRALSISDLSDYSRGGQVQNSMLRSSLKSESYSNSDLLFQKIKFESSVEVKFIILN